MNVFNYELKDSKWLDNGDKYAYFGEITVAGDPVVPLMLVNPTLEINLCRLYIVKIDDTITGVIGLEWVCSEGDGWCVDTEVKVLFTGEIWGSEMRYLNFEPNNFGRLEFPDLEFIQRSMEIIRTGLGE